MWLSNVYYMIESYKNKPHIFHMYWNKLKWLDGDPTIDDGFYEYSVVSKSIGAFFGFILTNLMKGFFPNVLLVSDQQCLTASFTSMCVQWYTLFWPYNCHDLFYSACVYFCRSATYMYSLMIWVTGWKHTRWALFNKDKTKQCANFQHRLSLKWQMDRQISTW